MGILSFFKEAGEKLFGHKGAAAAPTGADPTAANQAAAQAIANYIATQNLSAENLAVQYDGASATVTVTGEAADQATKEKIVLCCGNVHSVAAVNDQLTVAAASTESQFHTVASGDTLSAIAKKYYGDAGSYMKIFEANKPMLSDPDKIYPGQSLRIPA